MTLSPRQQFLDYVQHTPGAEPVVSPFLPHPSVIEDTLRSMGLAVGQDTVSNEIKLAHILGYQPMFMTDCHGLIFPWQEDPERSGAEWIVSTLMTPRGKWTRRISRALGERGDDSGFPVQTEADHELLALVCERIAMREPTIRAYFREWRQRVGDEGVLVIGHPHITWLAYQISQQNLVYHALDYPQAFERSMAAIYRATLVVFRIALQEGVDFMSDSTYGLEMTSPEGFDRVDLPYLRLLSAWTHAHGSLFWYHNCGQTRFLILSGRLSRIGADVIETIAPPPEGDNDLAESRRSLDPHVCSKGNLSLRTLRDGSADDVRRETRALVAAVRGFQHIVSTADAVLPGTPPANFITFIETAQEALT